jgi:hypothetical protein
MAKTRNTRHAGNFGEEQHDGRNIVSVSPFVDALTENYSRSDNNLGSCHA